MSATVDISEFTDAVLFVEEATGKDCADIINRAGLHIVIGGKGVQGAHQLTPHADPEAIEAELTSNKLVLKLVMAKAKRAGETLTIEQIKKRAEAIIRQRKNASHYTRGPGWHKAAVAFGGRGFNKQPGFDASEAARGSGSQATAQHLVAELINTAPAAEKIGLAPLRRAIQNQARDMVEYGRRKLQQTFDQVNP